MHAPRFETLTTLSMVLMGMLIIILAFFNITALREAAALPAGLQRFSMSTDFQSGEAGDPPTIIVFDGQEVGNQELLTAVLTRYRHGETVRVSMLEDGRISERTLTLVPRFTTFDIMTTEIIGAAFLLFGFYVLLRHRARSYAGILFSLAAGTSAMILLDWGSLTPYTTAINLPLRVLFDCAIWILPTLFFHFSFIYPLEKPLPKKRILAPWYVISLAGITASLSFLAAIYLWNVPVQDTWYMDIHGSLNDIFLIVGLLCTIANFEHSALTIPDAQQRKSAYWILLGIMAGPLVYVFMMLLPRMLLQHELVSDAVMQYTLLIAPVMFWVALRRGGAAAQQV